MENIKTEIKTSKYANFLQIYLKSKNLEVQNSKNSLINTHLTAIETECVEQTQWLKKALTMASQVIKNGSLNTQQRYHYEQLERHLTSNGNHRDLEMDDATMNGSRHASSSDDDGNGGDQLQTDDDELQPTRPCQKRLRLEEYDLDDLDELNGSCTDDDVGSCIDDMHTTFKMPAKRQRNLNETHVLTDTDTSDIFMGPSSSSTLLSKAKKNTIKNSRALTATKTNLVSNVLSDQMVKASSNTDQLRNGMF